MATLTIRISRSNNPRTPNFYRLYSAFNSNPTSSISLYKTGDISETDLISTINFIYTVLKSDRLVVKIDSSVQFIDPELDTFGHLESIADRII